MPCRAKHLRFMPWQPLPRCQEGGPWANLRREHNMSRMTSNVWRSNQRSFSIVGSFKLHKMRTSFLITCNLYNTNLSKHILLAWTPNVLSRLALVSAWNTLRSFLPFLFDRSRSARGLAVTADLVQSGFWLEVGFEDPAILLIISDLGPLAVADSSRVAGIVSNHHIIPAAPTLNRS
jgi:hypothetical protein